MRDCIKKPELRRLKLEVLSLNT